MREPWELSDAQSHQTPGPTHVPPADDETPSCSLCGECRGWKLVLPDGTGRSEPVPLDQPGRVVGLAEVEQRPTQVLDAVEGPHPQQILLESADEALGAAVALGGAKAGELSMPRKRSSFWKSSAMYCDPWSWRRARPQATSLAKPPKWRRTPWRSGSSASKRVPRRAA